MKCAKCGGEEFAKDGTTQYPPTGVAYETRQRLKCKGCGKVRLGGRVFFDEKAYKAYKKAKFDEFLATRKEYTSAKDNQGWGGYRIGDL